MKVGVIGAGVMGTGVTQDLLQNGIDVVLIDIAEDILEKAKNQIKNDMHLFKLFSKSKMEFDEKKIISQLVTTMDLNSLADVDYVIENVVEVLEIKRKIYEQIDKIAKKECVFAVNTSCISITQIGQYTQRASQIVGTHFMNPVPYKKFVEVIRGYYTSNETISSINSLFAQLGKEAIIVNDYPGFVSNRISHLMMNEAAFIVQDQVAIPEDVDKIFTQCFGHTMGPLATADLIGLDTVVDSLQILYDSYQDSKFRCCPLLKKMVAAGKCGRKTGEGFFSY